MSLAVLADHMASKGRGPDSMLIHMSPREVQGLQALAEHHGGTLTINPDTGLPEANFLEKLLPTIIGAGLTMAGVPPHIAALMVGGVETARTGDIGRGIGAGFQAYGGANLTSNLSEMGSAAIGAESAASGLTMSPELLAEFGGDLERGISAKDLMLQQQVTDRMAAATPFEKLSYGAEAFKNNPLASLKANAMPIAGAFGPAILAEMSAKKNMPQTVTKPGMIAPYASFGGQYVAGNPFQATPTKAAGGGLMGMNDGGYSPGQLNFTQQSEPVMRMAGGGVPGYAPGGFVPSDEDIFNYFKTPGLTDEIIARDMRAFNVSPADIARATGTQNQLADYEQRFAAQAVPEPVAAPVAPVAPVYEEPTYKPTVYTPEPEPEPTYKPTVYTPEPEPEPTYKPTVYTPEPEPDYFAQQFAPDVFSPVSAPAGIEALAATLPTIEPIAPKVTDEQIQTWWSDPKNKKLEDFEIKQVMLDNNVTPEQFANAIGANADTSADIISRYESALKPPVVTTPKDTYVAPAGIEALAATLPTALTPVVQAAAPVVQAAAPVVQAAAPVVTAPETSGGLAALSTAPTYNKYTNEEIAKYLVDNPNVDIAKAIKETKADPAAVNAYIASIADPFRGSTDTTGGSGVLGIYNQMKAQGVDPNELYAAELANDPKYAGYTQPMIQKAYDLSKGAYALSGQLKGNVSDKDWVKYMDDNKYSIDDAAQAFGLSRNEVRDRYNAVKAAEKVVIKDTVTGATGNDVIVPSGYHLENGVLVKNISATQNTTTNVTTPTDIATADKSALPVGVSGAGITTINPNGTISTRPDIPGIPEGGFTGMTSLRNAYTEGGGSLGVNKNLFAPKTSKEIEDRYKLTGGSKQAMDYLTGKTKYTPTPYTEDGQISKSYAESVMKIPVASSSKMYIFKNGKYEVNPEYAIPTYDKDGKKSLNLTNADVKTFMDTKPSATDFYTYATTNNLSPEQVALASGRPINEISKLFTGAKDLVGEDGKIDQTKLDEKTAADEKANFDATAYLKANPDVQAELDAGKANFGTKDDPAAAAYEHYLRYGKAGGRKYTKKAAGGGLMNMAMARGGMSQQFDLGGYSDGGRLLRGPGDGVSDSIPATIGNKRPARLADGEFVVPARIVSELGNGSTEAGARKLYAMMDRVQSARRGTVGKGRVAKNSRSDKYLPA
jgi:hypothetical protein